MVCRTSTQPPCITISPFRNSNYCRCCVVDFLLYIFVFVYIEEKKKSCGKYCCMRALYASGKKRISMKKWNEFSVKKYYDFTKSLFVLPTVCTYLRDNFFSVSVHFEVVFSAVCLLANNLCHFCYSFYMLLTTCKLVHFTSQYFVHSFVHSVFIWFLLFIFLFMECFSLPPVISSIHSICECFNVFQYELHSKYYLVCVRLCVNGCVPLGWVNAVAYAVCNMDFRSESHRIFIKFVTFFFVIVAAICIESWSAVPHEFGLTK